jgi:hypothetical protein
MGKSHFFAVMLLQRVYLILYGIKGAPSTVTSGIQILLSDVGWRTLAIVHGRAQSTKNDRLDEFTEEVITLLKMARQEPKSFRIMNGKTTI